MMSDGMMLAYDATMKSLAGAIGTCVTGSTGTQSAVMARPHVEVRPPVRLEKRVVAQTKVKSGQ